MSAHASRIAATLVIALVALAWAGGDAGMSAAQTLQAFPNIDLVVFGDTASETSHRVSAPGTFVEAGGLGEPCRRISAGGSITFEIKCDPVKQNYLTVRLWGSDSGAGMLFLSRPIPGEYGSAWPELDYMKNDFGYLRSYAERAFPGRFFYSTYVIPIILTRNKQTVKLTITSTGSANPYAASGADRVSKQGEASRGIYAAYTHTDPVLRAAGRCLERRGSRSGRAVQAKRWVYRV